MTRVFGHRLVKASIFNNALPSNRPPPIINTPLQNPGGSGLRPSPPLARCRAARCSPSPGLPFQRRTSWRTRWCCWPSNGGWKRWSRSPQPYARRPPQGFLSPKVVLHKCHKDSVHVFHMSINQKLRPEVFTFLPRGCMRIDKTPWVPTGDICLLEEGLA